MSVCNRFGTIGFFTTGFRKCWEGCWMKVQRTMHGRGLPQSIFYGQTTNHSCFTINLRLNPLLTIYVQEISNQLVMSFGKRGSLRYAEVWRVAALLNATRALRKNDEKRTGNGAWLGQKVGNNSSLS